MMGWLAQLRGAWRGSRLVPVQYRHAASPLGLGMARAAGRDAFAGRIALAAVPLVPAWLWNTGWQLRAAADVCGAMPVTGWRALFLLPGGIEGASYWQIGLVYFLPLLLVCLFATAVVETIFATARGRRVGPGWYLPPFLFALLLPAGVGLLGAAAGIALGVLLGRLIFGGPGKQLLSPALLGTVFLFTAYPEAFRAMPAGWLEDCAAVPTAWSAWTDGGRALTGGHDSWWRVFVGQEASMFGATSALGCLAAAIFLAGTGVLSWRTLAGGLVGLGVASFMLGVAGDAAFTLSWYWHGALGGFAFGLVFLASDPAHAPLTPAGRWFLGLATGALTVLLRSLDPAHPDATLHAVLLACLFAPLADEWAARRAEASRRRREESWP